MAAQIISLYERNAYTWDALRNRRYHLFERAWLDRFLALLPAQAAILDIGCGSAQPIAEYVVQQGHHVTGVDSSATLIGMGRSRFPEHEWLVRDMRTLNLGRTFGGLIAWDSFFHLCPDDQRRMFPVFRAHAGNRAALLFTGGPRAGEVYGEFCGEPLYHGSLDPEEYRSLLEDNGFDVVAYVPEDPTCGEHTVWLARLRD
ncbi:MAG TPA: class I SAM-dependent methyltransferase [Acidobacteriaceae bacterium]|jgi:SAM-dependent methyltransferase